MRIWKCVSFSSSGALSLRHSGLLRCSENTSISLASATSTWTQTLSLRVPTRLWARGKKINYFLSWVVVRAWLMQNRVKLSAFGSVKITGKCPENIFRQEKKKMGVTLQKKLVILSKDLIHIAKFPFAYKAFTHSLPMAGWAWRNAHVSVWGRKNHWPSTWCAEALRAPTI